nr:6-pyruvoyl-tetrahydropterin synthase-related protein [Anaerolineae bacterium]
MISAPIVIPEADLPDWMRRSRRRFDPGLLIVLLFSLGAAWSFLLNPALPRTGDSESYVFRAVDTAAALREGQLYPRWSPHALNGYGAPIPAFYPPAAPYLAGFIAVMFTDDTLVALRLLCAGALLLAGTAVYALVLRRVNAPAGVVAAALYVYSPFIGLTLPHLEGDLAGLLAAALLPALLWAVNRWLALRQPVDFALVAAGTAALLLTQPVYLPVAALLAGGLAALQVLETRQPAPVLPLLAALLAGVALAAFYWLPALVEMPFVRWLPAPVPAPAERLTLAGLVQPMRQIDPAALLTPPLFSLGVVLPGLALLSAATRLALRPAGARLE